MPCSLTDLSVQLGTTLPCSNHITASAGAASNTSTDRSDAPVGLCAHACSKIMDPSGAAFKSSSMPCVNTSTENKAAKACKA